jgi:hypothetical protein
MTFLKSLGLHVVLLVGGATISAVAFAITTVPKNIPAITWLWFSGAIFFGICAAARVFTEQALRSQQQLAEAQGGAALVQKEWREFRQHIETLNRENERLTAKLRRFLDLRPKPDVVLLYEGTAQFTALRLMNNGEMDATKVSVSPARLGQREMRFTGLAPWHWR